jgi:hypothetical protein
MTSHAPQLMGTQYTHQSGYYATRHKNAISGLKLPHFPTRWFYYFSKPTICSKLLSCCHVNPNIRFNMFFIDLVSIMAPVASKTSTNVIDTHKKCINQGQKCHAVATTNRLCLLSCLNSEYITYNQVVCTSTHWNKSCCQRWAVCDNA